MNHREPFPRPASGRDYARLGIAVVVLALAADRPVLAADPQADAVQSEAPQEIEVTGERAGPRLWRITKADHVLWLLGTLDPLPRKMVWKSREVEAVLGEVQEVIPTNPAVSVGANPFTWVRLYFQ